MQWDSTWILHTDYGNKQNKNKHSYSCTNRFLYWWKPQRFCWCSGAPQNVSPTNPELYRSLWRFGTSVTTSGPDPRYPQFPPVEEKWQNNTITCIIVLYFTLLLGLSICYHLLFFYSFHFILVNGQFACSWHKKQNS